MSEQIIAVIDEHLNGHGRAVFEAAVNAGFEVELNDEGRLDVADACALVDHESGGRNIFGADRGGLFPHEPVTADKVRLLLKHIKAGGASNGTGLSQITYPPFIREAESRGGAHLPEHQLSVGFEELKRLVDKLGYTYGIAAYNAGEGNAQVGMDNGYLARVLATREKWKNLLSTGLKKGERMVKASEIVAAARSVIGAPYRMWYEGADIPMYRDDGYSTAPPVWWALRNGLMCSDLLNYAREACGLPPVGGTEAWEHFITDWAAFDPNTPGVPGAVAVNGYTSEDQQGHVILYTGEHSCVQSILNPGVTEDFTDYETYGWGGWCNFQWYGFMPDVDYSEYLGSSGGDTVREWYLAIDKDGYLRANGPDWSNGWWDSSWNWHAA